MTLYTPLPQKKTPRKRGRPPKAESEKQVRLKRDKHADGNKTSAQAPTRKSARECATAESRQATCPTRRVSSRQVLGKEDAMNSEKNRNFQISNGSKRLNIAKEEEEEEEEEDHEDEDDDEDEDEEPRQLRTRGQVEARPTTRTTASRLGDATHCNALQHTDEAHYAAATRTTAPRASRLGTATHCNTLQHSATHCNTLQHTATCATRLGTGPLSPPPPPMHTHLRRAVPTESVALKRLGVCKSAGGGRGGRGRGNTVEEEEVAAAAGILLYI